MTLERKISIVQIIVAAIVVVMAIIRLVSSPEHNYIPMELLQFFLGLSMTVQGILSAIRKERKWLMVLNFGVAAFCFYISLETFFT